MLSVIIITLKYWYAVKIYTNNNNVYKYYNFIKFIGEKNKAANR